MGKGDVQVTPGKLIARIEAYYGKYETPAKRELVLDWLGERGGDLGQLWRAVLEGFSSQYRTPPDIAAMRKLRSGTQFVYHEGVNVGHLDEGRFIPNLGLLHGTEHIREYRESAMLHSRAAYGPWVVAKLKELGRYREAVEGRRPRPQLEGAVSDEPFVDKKVGQREVSRIARALVERKPPPEPELEEVPPPEPVVDGERARRMEQRRKVLREQAEKVGA